MRNKILAIIPYFGKLPNNFRQFLKSAKNSTLLDFLVVTDDTTVYQYPENFMVDYMSFKEFQTKVWLTLGDHIDVSTPYKICDYKPTYGKLFSESLDDYAFWAHIDVDLLLGDIDKFLIKNHYSNNDRTYKYGHFSVYRNTSSVNSIFLKKLGPEVPEFFNFHFASKTSLPCNFDEIGVNILLFENKLQFCTSSDHCNVNQNFYNFFPGNGKVQVPTLLVYRNGKTFVIEQHSYGINEIEVNYIHFQSRKFVENLIAESDNFIICRDGFMDITENNLDYLFKTYGHNTDSEYQRLYTTQLRKFSQKASLRRLTRELKLHPVRFSYNILQRYQATRYLARNPI